MSHDVSSGMMLETMIPRIAVRDSTDAMLIIQALQKHMRDRLDSLALQSRQLGADQYALSVQAIDETRNVCNLIEAVNTGILGDTGDDPADEQKDDQYHG